MSARKVYGKGLNRNTRKIIDSWFQVNCGTSKPDEKSAIYKKMKLAHKHKAYWFGWRMGLKQMLWMVKDIDKYEKLGVNINDLHSALIDFGYEKEAKARIAFK